MGVGKLLQELRQKQFMSQKELAARMGVAPSYVSMVETEKWAFPCHWVDLLEETKCFGRSDCALLEQALHEGDAGQPPQSRGVFLSKWGKLVAGWRAKHEQTREDLAQAVGLGRDSIYQGETGKINVPPRWSQGIANYYGLTDQEREELVQAAEQSRVDPVLRHSHSSSSHCGELVRQYREQALDSQKDLAVYLGVDPSYLSRVESGEVGLPARWVPFMTDRYRLSQEDQQKLYAAAVSSRERIVTEKERHPLCEFGLYIRALRDGHHQTIKDMAAILEVTPSAVSAVERGRQKVPPRWVDRIADYYRMNAQERDELFRTVEHSNAQIGTFWHTPQDIPAPTRTSYGQFVSSQRLLHRQTASDMARALHVSSSALRAVESGKKNVPSGWVERIAQMYDLSKEQKAQLEQAAAESQIRYKVDVRYSGPLQKKAARLFTERFETLDNQTAQKLIDLLEADPAT